MCKASGARQIAPDGPGEEQRAAFSGVRTINTGGRGREQKEGKERNERERGREHLFPVADPPQTVMGSGAREAFGGSF